MEAKLHLPLTAAPSHWPKWGAAASDVISLSSTVAFHLKFRASSLDLNLFFFTTTITPTCKYLITL